MTTDTVLVNNTVSKVVVHEQDTSTVLTCGIQGIQGPPGEGGTVDDKNYEFTQGPAELVWNITHDLGKYPAVTVVDSAMTEVVGDVEHIDVNTIRITFSAAFSGKAILN